MKKIIVAMAVVLPLGLVACSQEAPQKRELPAVEITSPSPTTGESQADLVRYLLQSEGMGYLTEGETDTTIDEAGRLTCQFFYAEPFDQAVVDTVSAGIESGLSRNEAITLVAALTVSYCPEVQQGGGSGFDGTAY